MLRQRAKKGKLTAHNLMLFSIMTLYPTLVSTYGKVYVLMEARQMNPSLGFIIMLINSVERLEFTLLLLKQLSLTNVFLKFLSSFCFSLST